MLLHDERPTATEESQTETDSLQFRLDTVTELARDLAGRFELSPLLGRILRHATTLLGCDSGSISLVDEKNGTYTKKADVGVGCQEGQTFPLSEGFTGELVRTRGTVILDEYSRVRAGHISPDDPRWHCAVIGVPILWDGEVIGSCIIFSAQPGRVFTTDDAQLAELFANHAAIALANARLHSRASEREREAAIAEERERSVRDVHETVGRSLASLLLSLDEADKAIRADRPVAPHIGTARTIAHDALTETRRTALGLGPASLTGRTLSEAITSELGWVESMTAASTSLVVVGSPRVLNPDIAHHAFKITQEALQNVVSHARAGSVRIGLIYTPHAVSVMIEDDGRGFDLQAAHGDHSSLPSGCLGLHGMSSRASHLGGELQIESTPGWGTKVRATIPDNGHLGGVTTGQRWKVLIADSRPIVSAGLVRLLHLNEPGISVTAEVTGIEQMIDAYALVRPDVLLVDLDLLGSDMAGVLARVRDLAPDAAIVALIENPTAEQIRVATHAGVRGYINKRSTADAIVRIIVAASQGDALLDGDTLEHLADYSRGVASGADTPTARELEVREMVAQGLPDKQIATLLQISVKTVEKHVGSLLRKTGARNRTMLVSLNADGHATSSPPSTPTV